MCFHFALVQLFEPPHDKTNKVSVRPAKTQWVAKSPNFLHADSEDSDQTESSLGAQPHC